MTLKGAGGGATTVGGSRAAVCALRAIRLPRHGRFCVLRLTIRDPPPRRAHGFMAKNQLCPAEARTRRRLSKSIRVNAGEKAR